MNVVETINAMKNALDFHNPRWGSLTIKEFQTFKNKPNRTRELKLLKHPDYELYLRAKEHDPKKIFLSITPAGEPLTHNKARFAYYDLNSRQVYVENQREPYESEKRWERVPEEQRELLQKALMRFNSPHLADLISFTSRPGENDTAER